MGLIGCGLMGTSVALAAKRQGLVLQVRGFDNNTDHTQSALGQGAIDQAADSPGEAIAKADLVILAVPVGSIPVVLAEIAPHLAPQALIMDMGSTKANVVQSAQIALGTQAGQFVGAHPIAGKHLWGPDHADAALFNACRVLITLSPANSKETLQQAQSFWQALGSHVSVCTPEEHDEAMAAISHLPHLLAFALMNSLGQQAEGKAFLELAGSGFRDFTRIAGAEPTLWRDVFVANAPALLKQLGYFKQALANLETQIQQTQQIQPLQPMNKPPKNQQAVNFSNSAPSSNTPAAELLNTIAQASQLRRDSVRDCIE